MSMKGRPSYMSPRQNTHAARQPVQRLTKNSSRRHMEQQRSYSQLSPQQVSDFEDVDDVVDISSLNLSEIQHKLSDIHDENRLLKINLNNEMNIRQRLERKNSDLNEKLNDARQGLQETRNALLNVQTATEQMISKRDQRENQLKKVIAINKSYETRISELEEKLAKSSEATKVSSKLAASKAALQEKDAAICDLEDQLAQMQSQLGSAKRDNKRLLEEKKDVESLLESAEKKIYMLESGVKLMDRRNQQLGAEFSETASLESASPLLASPVYRAGGNLFQPQPPVQQPAVTVPDVDLIHRLVETKLSSFLDERRTLETRLTGLEALLRDSQSKTDLLLMSQNLNSHQNGQSVLNGISLKGATVESKSSSKSPAASTSPVPEVQPTAAPPVVVQQTASVVSAKTSSNQKGSTFVTQPAAANNRSSFAAVSPVSKSRKVVSSEPVTKFTTQSYVKDAMSAVSTTASNSSNSNSDKGAVVPPKSRESESQQQQHVASPPSTLSSKTQERKSIRERSRTGSEYQDGDGKRSTSSSNSSFKASTTPRGVNFVVPFADPVPGLAEEEHAPMQVQQQQEQQPQYQQQAPLQEQPYQAPPQQHQQQQVPHQQYQVDPLQQAPPQQYQQQQAPPLQQPQYQEAPSQQPQYQAAPSQQPQYQAAPSQQSAPSLQQVPPQQQPQYQAPAQAYQPQQIDAEYNIGQYGQQQQQQQQQAPSDVSTSANTPKATVSSMEPTSRRSSSKSRKSQSEPVSQTDSVPHQPQSVAPQQPVAPISGATPQVPLSSSTPSVPVSSATPGVPVSRSTPHVPVAAPISTPSIASIAVAANTAATMAAQFSASNTPANGENSGFGEKIAAVKAEIAEMSARNKVTKAAINKFTEEFTAQNGRKPTKDDRRMYAKDMFSSYHKTAREIKKKQKILAKYQAGGKSFIGGNLVSTKSGRNLNGDGSDDDDEDSDD